MSTFGNNIPGNPVTTGEANAVEASVENTARSNNVLFANIAQIVSPSLMKDSGMRRAAVDDAMQSRTIDLPHSPALMKTIKLNLTSNGALLLSLNDGKQLFNHPVTKAERTQLGNIMNNPNLTDDMKLERLQNMVSGIGMSIKLSNNFEQLQQQNQSMSTTMHR